MNVDFLALLKSLFIPIWGLFCIALVWVIRTRPANKTADNDARRVDMEAAASAEEITNAQWKRFQAEILRLDAELAASHNREATAIERAIEAEAKYAKLEAIVEGIGTNRQDAALLAAAQRLLEDQRKREDGE